MAREPHKPPPLANAAFPVSLPPEEASALIAGLPDAPLDFQREIVIEPQTGKVRQAGSTHPDGEQIVKWRTQCERSLYVFLRGVWNMWWLWPPLHVPVCAWVQRVPPRAKALVMPRGCGKSTIVAQGLPPHILIQPKEHNIYFPGKAGTEQRILMVGENEDRIADHYRPIRQAFESNDLLRALWPHLFWERPSRDAIKWNDTELIIRRDDPYPDPSIRAIGVGGATTGSHPTVILKDDLTTERAANEPPTMHKAIRWHENSRALFAEREAGLEWITGTRWAVTDLIGHVQSNDPTVACNTKWQRIVEDGAVLYPPGFGDNPTTVVDTLRAQHGDVMFHLLYMNNVLTSGLTDFDPADLRTFKILGDWLVYDASDADERLEQELRAASPLAHSTVPDLRGKPLRALFGDGAERPSDRPRGPGMTAARMAYLRAMRGLGELPQD